MNRFGLGLLALLLLLGGCGYHFAGRGGALPDDVRKIYVEPFANRTGKPLLDTLMTSRLSEELARMGSLRLWARPQGADALLSGSVLEYSARPLSYDSADDITEYRSRMQIEAVLRLASNDRVLWKGQLTRNEDYASSADRMAQRDNETEAIERLVELMARDLYARMMDDF